jgi:hypothetical protein
MKDVINLLMIQHEAAKGSHNYWHVAANLVKAEFLSEEKKSEWVGLTDEEIDEGIKQSWVTEQAFQSAVWWAEAKLKEKNT